MIAVNANDPFARRSILAAASTMVKEHGSQDLSFADVAERANLDVATIKHHFDSRRQLIAEAQMSNYFAMVEPHHLVLSRVEAAVANDDQAGFWAAVEEIMAMAWSTGQVGDKWGIINLLHDVWSDPFSQRHFCDLLDIQFERWIAAIEGTKRLGWVDQDIDAKAITAVVWSASVGQVITSGSAFLEVTPENVRDFYMSFFRASHRQEPIV